MHLFLDILLRINSIEIISISTDAIYCHFMLNASKSDTQDVLDIFINKFIYLLIPLARIFVLNLHVFTGLPKLYLLTFFSVKLIVKYFAFLLEIRC